MAQGYNGNLENYVDINIKQEIKLRRIKKWLKIFHFEWIGKARIFKNHRRSNGFGTFFGLGGSHSKW